MKPFAAFQKSFVKIREICHPIERGAKAQKIIVLALRVFFVDLAASGLKRLRPKKIPDNIKQRVRK
jgi:hypothetical protein